MNWPRAVWWVALNDRSLAEGDHIAVTLCRGRLHRGVVRGRLSYSQSSVMKWMFGSPGVARAPSSTGPVGVVGADVAAVVCGQRLVCAGPQELVHALRESIIGACIGSLLNWWLVSGFSPGVEFEGQGGGSGDSDHRRPRGWSGTAQVGHALGHHGQGLGEFEPGQM